MGFGKAACPVILECDSFFSLCGFSMFKVNLLARYRGSVAVRN